MNKNTRLKFSSKAKTLQKLTNKLKSAYVAPLLIFKVNDYIKFKNKIIKNIINNFSSELIVRSSSSNEDGYNESNAGKFKSILNVKLQNDDIEKAIEKVISSYKKNSNDQEILIQPMLKNVSMSGVIFTADQDTLAPYYIINYDKSGSTTGVTSGNIGKIKSLIIFRDFNYNKDKKIKKILKTCKEIENIFKNSFLDIEFAISNNKLYVLQVRPIVVANKINLSNINLGHSLKKLYKKIKKLNNSHPRLLGNKNFYGIMPDWNPAEIIGAKPKWLAFSLYKEFITDEIWAYQRDNYGYRNLRSFPLLVSFLGVPYVDLRVSFNSFVPKKLNNKISLKLVNYYLREFYLNKSFHDKIEFKIVFSCYYFGIDKKLIKLKEKNFSRQEIKLISSELKEITNSIIDPKNGLFVKDLKKIDTLNDRYDEIVNSRLSTIDKIYWLTEDCKRYGTLPFAGIARAAFVATQFLNSFVDENILSVDEKNLFLKNLETVSKKINLEKSFLSKKNFLKKYGHLRPGTYNICSKRYDEAYRQYFSIFNFNSDQIKFNFSKIQKEKIKKLIIKHGLVCNFNELIDFIKNSIEGREFAKFIFTKNLSKVINYIEQLGSQHGFKRNDLAYLDFQVIKNLYSTLDYRDVKNIIATDIQKNKNLYKFTTAVKLPSQITSEKDVYSFFLANEEPNFITNNTVTAETIEIDNIEYNKFFKKINLKNKIIFIKSADPGYDFIFSKNIAGLITCYGGLNSHMSIRCAELGLPAVIGCGEKLYNKYLKNNILNIDCSANTINVIS